MAIGRELIKGKFELTAVRQCDPQIIFWHRGIHTLEKDRFHNLQGLEKNKKCGPLFQKEEFQDRISSTGPSKSRAQSDATVHTPRRPALLQSPQRASLVYSRWSGHPLISWRLRGKIQQLRRTLRIWSIPYPLKILFYDLLYITS